MLTMNIHKRLNQFELQTELSVGNEVLAILGASGAGKSMLLKCLSGLVKPDSGLISHLGKPLFNADQQINLPARDRKIGFLFQNYALFPHMTVYQNITFGLEHLPKPERLQRAEALIERFRLHGLSKHYPNQLSGGQQQRVALARAMAIEPDILLLDEPLSALDEHLRNHMLADLQFFLNDYKGSVLYVTHHMEEAYRLADRIVVMEHGKIVEVGHKTNIFMNPKHLETGKITGVKNLSPAKVLDKHRLDVPEWGVQLQSSNICSATHKQPSTDVYVGIRPNQLQLADCNKPEPENCFNAWLVDHQTTPFRNQVQIKLGASPEHPLDFHLIWELSSEQLGQVLILPQPFRVVLPVAQVLVLGKALTD